MVMSPDEQTIYKNMVENLSLMKRQQWVITAYAVAIFVGLYGLMHDNIKPQAVEVLIWLIIVGCVLCCAMTLRIQFSIASQRRALDRVGKARFDAEQIKTFGLSYRAPFWRDIDFVLAFIAVAVVSAWIVIYLWLYSA